MCSVCCEDGVKHSTTSSLFHRSQTPPYTITTLRRRPGMTCHPLPLKPSETQAPPMEVEETSSTADAAPVPAEGTVGFEIVGAPMSVTTAKIEALGLRTESVGGHGLETSLRPVAMGKKSLDQGKESKTPQARQRGIPGRGATARARAREALKDLEG